MQRLIEHIKQNKGNFAHCDIEQNYYTHISLRVCWYRVNFTILGNGKIQYHRVYGLNTTDYEVGEIGVSGAMALVDDLVQIRQQARQTYDAFQAHYA